MNDRDIDVQGAEKVLGWEIIQTNTYSLASPSERIIRYRNGLEGGILPYFTTSAGADYIILTYVASEWGGNWQWKFSMALQRTWVARYQAEGHPHDMGTQSVLNYRPGDYIRAALTAIGVQL